MTHRFRFILGMTLAVLLVAAPVAVAQEAYTYVEWEGLIVPIPPTGEWATNTPPREVFGVSALATASIVYPDAPQAVERPFGPTFTILPFNGTLDQWLTIERQNFVGDATTGVVEATLRDVRIAGVPAKAFQRTDPSLGPSDYYILKLDEQRLLRIYSGITPQGVPQRVIEGLRFAGLPDTGAASTTVGALLLLGASVLAGGVLVRRRVWVR